ncbi:hypothetical protein [Polymorphospora rubra]|uniref:hypothetical protein n=1 Tax=Polymorphospora rubra TaxID=338584 RepID=UPI001BB3BA72|nr:hypothetical protein [Polymorphospora rubra]
MVLPISDGVGIVVGASDRVRVVNIHRWNFHGTPLVMFAQVFRAGKAKPMIGCEARPFG